MAQPFALPDLGEGIESGDVVTVLVSVGDTIEAEQGVIEIETDKALIEVPSDLAGTVASVEVSEGDSVKPGDVLVTVETGNGAQTQTEEVVAEVAQVSDPEPEPSPPAVENPQAEPAQTEPSTSPPPTAAPPTPAPAPATPSTSRSDGPIPAAPATRRFARELGVDLAQVTPSGEGGRITKEDVQEHVKGSITGGGGPRFVTAAAAPLPDFSRWGEIEREPLPKIRQVIAANLSQAWAEIPHVTQFGSADISNLESLRQRNKTAAEARGVNLTPTVLVLKAVVSALKAFPQFNASLDVAAQELVYKRYYHLGIAVDTERGLMVPNIRDAERKDIYELAAELADLGERARTNKISPDELQGGTFSITNLGSLHGGPFTPIVNPPQVAILGVGHGKEEAVVCEGRIEPRLMMPVCVSYDHRVVDGADGVRFLNAIIASLEAPEQMLLGG
ncbi:MAG: branched-chain alpha-keto acid dehydrogenase subunit E2 [Gemmatimonadetes bacterium]|nr:branched-chain alpha-keto acid dehydrogenase subunit E2 [Gemmatimonadota bacterium]